MHSILIPKICDFGTHNLTVLNSPLLKLFWINWKSWKKAIVQVMSVIRIRILLQYQHKSVFDSNFVTREPVTLMSMFYFFATNYNQGSVTFQRIKDILIYKTRISYFFWQQCFTQNFIKRIPEHVQNKNDKKTMKKCLHLKSILKWHYWSLASCALHCL